MYWPLLRLFVLVALLATPNAHALDLAETEQSHSRLELFSEHAVAAPGQVTWLAVKISPRANWHTYWKNAGDSGAAPIFDWNISGGEIGEPHYPAPSRLPIGPLVNYGFDGQATILFPLTISGANSVDAQLEAEWLVCEVECVPQFAALTFRLPVGDASQIDPQASDIFRTARQQLPEPSYWDARLEIYSANSRLTVFMAPEEVAAVKDAYFYPAVSGVADYAATQVIEGVADGLVLDIPRPAGAPMPVDAAGVLELIAVDGTSTVFSLEPELAHITADTGGLAQEELMTASSPGLPIWQAMVFALVGGVILNLMPCVFPVLSLKAFAFVSANYKTPANRRKEGWAYTLGIWVSFMVIVAALLAVRAGGTAVGWGFQLQEPLFVGGMSLLMILVALSLSGMFSISFGAEGAGHHLAAREGVRGAFFKGVLATLVATPCTAPLMAPAIGFALTQPVLIVLLIFSFLALGLALPFLALSYSPALARLMPRPGPWMEKVKEGLAFPMYLTAAWLIYVFDREAGAVATFVLLGTIVATVFAIWLWRQSTHFVARAISLVIAVGSLTFAASEPWDISGGHAEGSVSELAYSGETLQESLNSGRPVFVYFTADWCITCKVNERLAIMTDRTQSALKEAGAIMLKGDWTNRNAEIARVLASHGRAGVPLYLYYPPGARKPIVLPEVLGPGTVADLVLSSAS